MLFDLWEGAYTCVVPHDCVPNRFGFLPTAGVKELDKNFNPGEAEERLYKW